MEPRKVVAIILGLKFVPQPLALLLNPKDQTDRSGGYTGISGNPSGANKVASR